MEALDGERGVGTGAMIGGLVGVKVPKICCGGGDGLVNAEDGKGANKGVVKYALE